MLELSENSFDAQAFIEDARQDWGKSGLDFRGSQGLKQPTVEAIKKGAKSKEVSEAIFGSDVKNTHVIELTKKFEEMCRRLDREHDKSKFIQKSFYITPDMRTGIMQSLAGKLKLNHQALERDKSLFNKDKANDFFLFTLYHGAAASTLVSEYPLGEVIFSILKSPLNPKKVLDDLMSKIPRFPAITDPISDFSRPVTTTCDSSVRVPSL